MIDVTGGADDDGFHQSLTIPFRPFYRKKA